MKKTIVLASVAAMAIATAGCQRGAEQAAQTSAPSQAKPAQGPQPPRPVASIQEIMDSQVDPAADTLWDSVQVISDATGVHEFHPRTDEDWKKVRNAALVLVEAPNLLAVPGRQVAAPGVALADADAPGMLTREQIQMNLDSRHDEFAGFARALQEVGLEAVQAIDRKDVSALDVAGSKIDGVCEQCHLQFWYPQTPKPAGG